MKMIKSIPALPVIDIKKATDFYKTKLGFSVPHQDEGFAIVTRDNVEIHLWASNDESWRDYGEKILTRPIISGAESFLAGTASCRIEVNGIDELYEEYKKQDVLHNPETVVTKEPWGTQEFHVVDLHRNLLTFYEWVS